MTTSTLQVSTPGGTMPVHLHRAEETGATPLVVLFMDAPGVRPGLHQHAERLVRAGFRAAIPDLYYQIEPADRPDVERLRAGDPEEFARMGSLVARLDDTAVLEDTRLMVAALPGSGDAPWGCVGFCIGGRFGLRAAEAFGERLAAAALLHPSRLVTDEPDSPHLAVGNVAGHLYLGFGENDHVTPPSAIPPLREQLVEHGIVHRIEIIPGADHGFTMPGMPAYDEAAAERAWAGTLDLLASRL